jgi:indolepyruvate ferredoxin oxidoreductase beta subunit
VAQRTGATIYYVELFPETAIAAMGREPVLSLMPVAGDVDIVVASELMEAGRAIMRGFVTPDRTTLISSTHRVYAISEKSARADGRADGSRVINSANANAARFIGFDFERTAQEGGSVISAAMFGALAGSGALPIERRFYEDVIRDAAVAVKANLATFGLAFDRAAGPMPPAVPTFPSAPAAPTLAPSANGVQLLARLSAELPTEAHDLATHGLRRVVDFQDFAYGARYLDRLGAIAACDTAQGHLLTTEAARHLALWMTFEDTFRVADLKTRAGRFERFRGEIQAEDGQIVDVTEFMHPRLEEICDSLPASLGNWIRRTGWTAGLIEGMFAKGRKVRTSRLSGFLLLYLVSGGRRWRRKTPRFLREDAAIDAWLERVREAAGIDYTLACELVACQKLVRGYGDTHDRGSRNFAALIEVYDARKGEAGLARKLQQYRDAALSDDSGAALADALAHT